MRTLKPEFFRSEDISSLSPFARLFFQGLWCHADADGRLLDRPRRLLSDILPFDRDLDGEVILSELAANPGLIVRYVAEDGRRCIQITNFARHQRPHPKEPRLGLPPPNTHSVGQSREQNGLVLVEPGKGSYEPVRSGIWDLGSGLGSGGGSGSGSPTPPVGPEVPSESEQEPEPPSVHESEGTGTAPWPGSALAKKTPAQNAVDGWGLPTMFGNLRKEILGGEPWSGLGCKPGKPQTMAETIRATPGLAEIVEPSMRRFLMRVKAGEHPEANELARNPAKAFGYWFADLTEDYETARGTAPKVSTRATGPPGGRPAKSQYPDLTHRRERTS